MGRNIIKNMEKITSIILGVLFMGTLSSCSSESIEQAQTDNLIKGAVLPHHLIVDNYMDDFYSEIASEVDVERVIILAPNHFHYGFNYVQTTNYIDGMPLDLDFVNYLYNEEAIYIEPKYFDREHGVFVHHDFLQRHFPDAKIVPIIMKKYTPKEILDDLVDTIAKRDLENTLIISSIDFTHVTSEETALKNDDRTVNWLNEWSEMQHKEGQFDDIHELAISSEMDTEEAVAIDSPESLYVMTQLMENQNAYNYTPWKRTSSASLTGITDPLQNTSHIFMKFEKS
ncbi:AmmeMemoRadiSam system protein B [Patescibacteria group bacterium]